MEKLLVLYAKVLRGIVLIEKGEDGYETSKT